MCRRGKNQNKQKVKNKQKKTLFMWTMQNNMLNFDVGHSFEPQTDGYSTDKQWKMWIH